ncbi:hypothetical protein ACFL4L_02700 [bacterium]
MKKLKLFLLFLLIATHCTTLNYDVKYGSGKAINDLNYYFYPFNLYIKQYIHNLVFKISVSESNIGNPIQINLNLLEEAIEKQILSEGGLIYKNSNTTPNYTIDINISKYITKHLYQNVYSTDIDYHVSYYDNLENNDLKKFSQSISGKANSPNDSNIEAYKKLINSLFLYRPFLNSVTSHRRLSDGIYSKKINVLMASLHSDFKSKVILSKKVNFAIVEINSQDSNNLVDILTSSFINIFNDKNIYLYTRSELSTLFDEYALQMSGFTNENQILEKVKLSPIDYFIICNLTIINNNKIFSSKIVRVSNAQIISSKSISID